MQLIKAVAVALATLATITSAQALELVNTVRVEIVTTTAQGAQITLADPVNVAPGDVVVVMTEVRNELATRADDVVIATPVPAYLQFIAAGEGPQPRFSIDGGARFDALERLRVRMADGDERPATTDDITNIQWILSGALAPGARRTVSYRARVR